MFNRELMFRNWWSSPQYSRTFGGVPPRDEVGGTAASTLETVQTWAMEAAGNVGAAASALVPLDHAASAVLRHSGTAASAVGVGNFLPQAVYFNGNAWLERSVGGFTGVASGTQIGGSFWINFPTPSQTTSLFGNIGTPVQVRLNSTGTIEIRLGDGGTKLVFGTTNPLSTNTWHHVAWFAYTIGSIGNKITKIVVDGVDQSLLVSIDSDASGFTMVHSNYYPIAGAGNSGVTFAAYIGYLAEFMVWFNIPIDWTNPTSLTRVYASGKAVDPGARGQYAIPGYGPTVYMSARSTETFLDLTTNKGSGGNFHFSGERYPLIANFAPNAAESPTISPVNHFATQSWLTENLLSEGGAVTTRPADTGQMWQLQPGTSATGSLTGGLIRGNTSGTTSVYQTTTDPAINDYDVEISGYLGIVGAIPILRATARMSTATQSGYFADIRYDDQSYRLRRIDAGGVLVSQIITTTILPGSYTLRLVVRGSRMFMFVNGIQVLQLDDATYPTGRPGFGVGGSETYIDWIKVTYASDLYSWPITVPWQTDSFTDVDGTTLGNHTPVFGPGWSVSPSQPNSVAIQSNKATNSGGNAIYLISGSPATADYELEGDWTMSLFSAISSGFVLRFKPGATFAGYYLRMTTPGTITLYRYSDISTAVTIQTNTGLSTWVDGQTYHLKAQVLKSHFRVWLDGVLVIDAVDSTYPDGTAGILIRSQVQLDNFEARYVYSDYAGTGTGQTFYDSFVGTDATLLINHAPEKGFGWVKHAGYATDFTILSNAATSPSFNIVQAAIGDNYGPDYEVEINVSGPLTGFPGVVLRQETKAAAVYTGYWVALNTSTIVLVRQNQDSSANTLQSVSHLKKTNYILYSEQFDNAAWNLGTNTVVANDIAGPFANTFGDAFVEDGVDSTHYTQQNMTVLNATTYTHSVYIKKGTRDWVSLDFTGSPSPGADFARFDLTNQVLGLVGGNAINPTITNIGNGWYRCSIGVITIAAGTLGIQILSASTGGATTYQGVNGDKTHYGYGSQFEVGSTPSTYIPTTAWASVAPFNLKARVVGNTITAYLDDVQFINITDTTYPLPGRVCLASGLGVLTYDFKFTEIKTPQTLEAVTTSSTALLSFISASAVILEAPSVGASGSLGFGGTIGSTLEPIRTEVVAAWWNLFTYIGAGQITIAGSNNLLKTFVGSGGATVAGLAGILIGLQFRSQMRLEMAGSSISNFSLAPMIGGGTRLGGSARSSVNHSYLTSAGILLAGSVEDSLSKVVRRSGGASTGGAAQLSHRFAMQASGGGTTAGSATFGINLSSIGSGGLAVGGHAASGFTVQYFGDGMIRIGGAAVIPRTGTYVGGASLTSFFPIALARRFFGYGSLAIGGHLDLEVTRELNGSGGVLSGGGAGISFLPMATEFAYVGSGGLS